MNYVHAAIGFNRCQMVEPTTASPPTTARMNPQNRNDQIVHPLGASFMA
jgi:hypothetical protein